MCTRPANCSAAVIKKVLADGAGHLWERTVKVVSYTTFLKERQQNLTAFLHAALIMDPMVEDRDSTPANPMLFLSPCHAEVYKRWTYMMMDAEIPFDAWQMIASMVVPWRVGDRSKSTLARMFFWESFWTSLGIPIWQGQCCQGESRLRLSRICQHPIPGVTVDDALFKGPLFNTF